MAFTFVTDPTEDDDEGSGLSLAALLALLSSVSTGSAFNSGIGG